MASFLCGCTQSDVIDAVRNKAQEISDSGLIELPDNVRNGDLRESDLDKLSTIDPSILQNIINESNGLYYFGKLDADGQLIYAQILYVLENMQSPMVLSTTDVDLADKVFNYVQYDHPEIFYIDGSNYMKYMVGDEVRKLTFEGQYTMDMDAVLSKRAAVESYVNQFTTSLASKYPEGADEYHIIKYAYEYIVQNTEYVTDAPDNQNILSVMINGQSVCQGYTKTMQYLLSSIGIDATMVAGEAKGTPHSWNLVKADGDYYYLDVTWGDPSYAVDGQDESVINSVPPVNYDFLLITSEDIKTTHTFDDEAILPTCDAVKDNYYIRENLYFTEIDEDKLQQAFDNAYANNDEYLTIKMSDSYVYEDMWNYLLEEQKVFNYLRDMTSVSYAENIEQRYMVFWI